MTRAALLELDPDVDVPLPPWPWSLDHVRVGRLNRLGGDVLLDPLTASPQPAPVPDRLDPAIEHPIPGFGIRAAKKLGDFPDRHEVHAVQAPWHGGVAVGEPSIDMGLQKQRLAPVVLLDGGDLGEKLVLDVLGRR